LSPPCQYGAETYNDATFPVGYDVKKELDAIGVELDENGPLQFIPNFGSSGVEKILLEKEEIPPDHKVLKSLFPLTPLNGDQYVRAVFHLKQQNVRANGNDALYSIYGIIKNNIDDFMKDECTSVTGYSVFGGYPPPKNASEFAINARRFLVNAQSSSSKTTARGATDKTETDEATCTGRETAVSGNYKRWSLFRRVVKEILQPKR
jgi:hypothetical protein